MLERDFQRKLIIKIKERFPGAVVLKNDPLYIQGFPDLTILYGTHWAVLESKLGVESIFQPNQRFYLDLLNKMSFASPVNRYTLEEILNEMERSFISPRNTLRF
jgi:hypothetical protein